ncbi:hypothetical protein [Marinicella sp. W31]|uniref:hypothetical protein n=1 Tax=Marinicella sp. W31 TaxID=3023713 RepID=UPI0037582D1F
MSSNITIINQSSDPIRIGIFRKQVKELSLDIHPWLIVSPPPAGGSSIITIPDVYSVFGQYSLTNSPNQMDMKTNTLEFDATMGVIATNLEGEDGDKGVVLKPSYEHLIRGELYLQNDADIAIMAHLQVDGQDVFKPELISPGGRLVEELVNGIYLNITQPGDNNSKQQNWVITNTPISPDQTAVVSGSKYTGYAIAVED